MRWKVAPLLWGDSLGFVQHCDCAAAECNSLGGVVSPSRCAAAEGQLPQSRACGASQLPREGASYRAIHVVGKSCRRRATPSAYRQLPREGASYRETHVIWKFSAAESSLFSRATPAVRPQGSLARELAPQRLRELPSAALQQDKAITPKALPPPQYSTRPLHRKLAQNPTKLR